MRWPRKSSSYGQRSSTIHAEQTNGRDTRLQTRLAVLLPSTRVSIVHSRAMRPSLNLQIPVCTPMPPTKNNRSKPPIQQRPTHRSIHGTRAGRRRKPEKVSPLLPPIDKPDRAPANKNCIDYKKGHEPPWGKRG